MDPKLGILLTILGVFVAVIVMVQRANRPQNAPRPATPSLDEQLALLDRAGLPLSPGVTRNDLTDFGPAETYEGDPWRLLLMTFGLSIDRPPHLPYCPRAHLIRTDDLETPEEYARQIAHLARVADVPFTTDTARGLTATLAGQGLDLPLKPKAGFADADAMEQVLEALRSALPPDEGLYFLDTHPQVIVLRLSRQGFELIDTRAPGLLRSDWPG